MLTSKKLQVEKELQHQYAIVVIKVHHCALMCEKAEIKGWKEAV
jgi:hypothetical protein